MTERIFLHGLDSSGSGTKGTFFSRRYPDMLCPDFRGTLEERLTQLYGLIADSAELVVVGSSFGGLMAAHLAVTQPTRVRRLILLAPALNFPEYRTPKHPIAAETILVIGSGDVVTPPDIVHPMAEASFSNLTVNIVDDDHLLHRTYRNLDWEYLLR
jgi:alpha-beta hydrolase superfamily lysophospholipase